MQRITRHSCSPNCSCQVGGDSPQPLHVVIQQLSELGLLIRAALIQRLCRLWKGLMSHCVCERWSSKAPQTERLQMQQIEKRSPRRPWINLCIQIKGHFVRAKSRDDNARHKPYQRSKQATNPATTRRLAPPNSHHHTVSITVSPPSLIALIDLQPAEDQTLRTQGRKLFLQLHFKHCSEVW